MDKSVGTTTYEFMVGQFMVDVRRCTLSASSQVVKLEPKIMDLLRLLAERPNVVVSREEIERRLWGDITVSADSVPQAIRKLRRALDDSPTDPDFIKTYPKRGYCLIAEVSSNSDDLDKPTDDAASGFNATEKILEPQQLGITGTDQAKVPSSNRFSFQKIGVFLVFAALTALFLVKAGQNEESAIIESVLLESADDYYFRFTDFGASSAIDIYERAYATKASNIRAKMGLLNAHTQQISQQISKAGYNDPYKGYSLPAFIDDWMRAISLEEASTKIGQSSQVGLSPGYRPVLIESGFLEDTSSAFAQAQEHLLAKLEANGADWIAAFKSGELYLFLGDFQAARTSFETAFKSMQDNPEISIERACLAFLIGLHEEVFASTSNAVTWYEEALGDNPYYRPMLIRLARLYATDGQKERLNQVCTRLSLMKLQPDVCA